MPGGFGNRKCFLVLRHSTKNMLLTAEMPLRESVGTVDEREACST